MVKRRENPQNQRSSCNNGAEIKVKEADTHEAVAWKNGCFQFDEVCIEAVMGQSSRWHNIDVSSIGGIPMENFRG